jgi:hypothetical protein
MIGTHTRPIAKPANPAIDNEFVNMALDMNPKSVPVPFRILFQQFVVTMNDYVLGIRIPPGPFFSLLDVAENKTDRCIDHDLIVGIKVGGLWRKPIGPVDVGIRMFQVFGDLISRTGGKPKENCAENNHQADCSNVNRSHKTIFFKMMIQSYR